MNQSGSVFCNICKVFLPSEASYEFHLTTPKHLTKMHDGNLPDHIPPTTLPLGTVVTEVTSAPSSTLDAAPAPSWDADIPAPVNNVQNNNSARSNQSNQQRQTATSATSKSENNTTNSNTQKNNKNSPNNGNYIDLTQSTTTAQPQSTSEHSSKSDHKKSADVPVKPGTKSDPILINSTDPTTPNRSRVRRRSPSPEKDSPLRDRVRADDEQAANTLRNSSENIKQKRKKPRNEGPVTDSAATFDAPIVISDAVKVTPAPAKKIVDFPEYIPLGDARSARPAPKRRDSAEGPTTTDVTRSMDLDGTSSYQPHHTPMTRPPWAVREYPRTNWGLHEEIKDFCRFMSPIPAERAMRKDVIARLSEVVKGVWPDAEVHVFGSISTELYLPSSDIDIVVIGAPPVGSSLYILAQHIERKGISKEVQVIDKAKVPIVKLMDSKTGTLVDISFNKGNGPENSRLVRAFMKEHKAIKYLVLVLKCFLQQRQLNEPYSGGVGSYALILMLVSFLQTNTGENNLGALLTEFMHLYGVTFNYFTVGISVREGGFYFSKVEREWYDYSRPYQICLEDPNDLENDVGRSSFKILNVRRAFEFAYKRLSTNLTKGDYAPTLLTRIIYPDHNMIAHRMYIQSLYPTAQDEEEYSSNSDSEGDSAMSEGDQAPDEGFSSDSSSSSLQVDENLIKQVTPREQPPTKTPSPPSSKTDGGKHGKAGPGQGSAHQNGRHNKAKSKPSTDPHPQSVHTSHHGTPNSRGPQRPNSNKRPNNGNQPQGRSNPHRRRGSDRRT